MVIALAACPWIYLLVEKEHLQLENVRRNPTQGVSMPFGYDFCGRAFIHEGNERHPSKNPQRRLNVTMILPHRIVSLSSDEPVDAKETVFFPGNTDVYVYSYPGITRLIHTQGTIQIEDGRLLLNVVLEIEKWPAGRYLVGIAGRPFFGYCIVDFVD
jgi:hypothetical protein